MPQADPAPGSTGQKESSPELWVLKLYVAGASPKSLTAFANLRRICETHLHGRYRIELVDLIETPRLARSDQIVAVPSLVRQLPPPLKKIIGDLADEERVLVGLDLRPAGSTRSVR